MISRPFPSFRRAPVARLRDDFGRPETGRELDEVVGQGSFESQERMARGVLEAETRRVERRTPERRIASPCPTIYDISDQGISGCGQVDADLMSASGFGTNLEFADTGFPKASQDAP